MRSLLLLTFCLLWPTSALPAQEDTKAFTDEQDARVATIAARQNAVAESWAAGNKFHEAGDNVKAASEWNRAGRFQLRLHKPKEAIATFQRALDVVRTHPDTQTHIDTLNGLARAYERIRQCDGATPLLRKATYLSDKIGYVEGEAEALLVETNCLPNKLVAFNKAQESLEIWQSVNNKLGVARAYLVL